MIVLRDEREFQAPASVVALGTFDGVHAGHRALIRQAAALAEEMGAVCAVYTFDRNPLCILRPEKAPAPLMTLAEKLAALEALGVECAVVRRFDAAFARASAETFLCQVAKYLRPRALVVGYNYSFGAGGAGNPALIQALAGTYGYRPVVVPPVVVDGAPVSSTRIRALLAAGEGEAAARLL